MNAVESGHLPRRYGGDGMQRALRLFDQLEIRYLPTSQARLRGARDTHCANIVNRLIEDHGIGHATLALRVIVETEGNEGELIADVILGISALLKAHPRWADLGLKLLEAFDQVKLAEIRRTAKASEVRPLYSAIAALLYMRLVDILGPSKVIKQKPVKVKLAPKPPRSITRIPENERNIALGIEIADVRSRVPSNKAFGRLRRERWPDLDTTTAVKLARVARLYGKRPDVYRRLSWNALVLLSSPTLTTAARHALEAQIAAGKDIKAPDIRRARARRPARSPQQQERPRELEAA
jgi:hypothetical protein